MSEFIWATGRRKTSTARVRITVGSGKILVNKQELKDYFGTEQLVTYITQPLAQLSVGDKFDIFVNVQGGGKIGQAGATRHGISRALVKNDEATRDALKEGGFLTRDARKKERKKAGQPGARKRFQFSKR
ncbi:MAG: 30S ribosomal protein S9 [Lentisphaeria bacterium]|nr:30S ribosomal protein S9 [Lentisphaeria bacterium]